MMSLRMLSATRRLAVPVAKQQQQKRNFALGGHHGPPPEWTGIDKVVRGYFPEDYQCTLCVNSRFPGDVLLADPIERLSPMLLASITVAIAILGGYVVLATFGKLMSGGKKKEEAPVAVAAPSSTLSSSAIPSIDSDDFAKFLETDAFLKLLENEKDLSAAIEA